MLFVMTTGRYPFGFDGRRSQGGVSTHQVMRQIKRGGEGVDFTDAGRPLSAEFVRLVQEMLVVDPGQRLNMDQILASSWVQSDDGYTAAAAVAERAELRSVEWPEQPRLQRRRTSLLVPTDMDGFDTALDLGGGMESFDTGGILQLAGGRGRSLDDDDDGLLLEGPGDALDLGGSLGLNDHVIQGPDQSLASLSPVIEATTSREQTESGGGSSRRARPRQDSPRPRAQTAASRFRCSLIIDARESAESVPSDSDGGSPVRPAASTPRIGRQCADDSRGGGGLPEEETSSLKALAQQVHQQSVSCL